jgi:GNAT superfamily N-acetyltransferase
MANDELRPFAAAEAEQVASWAVSAEDCTSLTGSPSAVSADDIALWTMEANWAFTLRLDGDLVAYGEIMEDEVEGDVEVQHLLVAPDMRGKGVGRTLLAHLCTFLAAERSYPEVWLRAGRTDAAVLACAHAGGFAEVPHMSGPRYLWLKRSLTLSLPPPISGGVSL